MADNTASGAGAGGASPGVAGEALLHDEVLFDERPAAPPPAPEEIAMDSLAELVAEWVRYVESVRRVNDDYVRRGVDLLNAVGAPLDVGLEARLVERVCGAADDAFEDDEAALETIEYLLIEAREAFPSAPWGTGLPGGAAMETSLQTGY